MKAMQETKEIIKFVIMNILSFPDKEISLNINHLILSDFKITHTFLLYYYILLFATY